MNKWWWWKESLYQLFWSTSSCGVSGEYKPLTELYWLAELGEVLSFLLSKGQWLALPFVRSNSMLLFGEFHVKGLQIPVLLKSHHLQDLLAWAHTLWPHSSSLTPHPSYPVCFPRSVHLPWENPHLSQWLEHKDSTPLTSALITKVKKCEYPGSTQNSFLSLVMSPYPAVGKLPVSDVLSGSKWPCSTFGLTTKERGSLYRVSSPVAACQLLQYFWQSGEVQAQAGSGAEGAAGQGWLPGLAPGCAAGASPALGCSSGKPWAQLVGAPEEENAVP